MLHVPMSNGYTTVTVTMDTSAMVTSVKICRNECRKGTHHFHCGSSTNIKGGFECDCESGYGGNGETCSDVIECSARVDNCDFSAACTNYIWLYRQCITCIDDHECVDGSDNCAINRLCTHMSSSFSCSCKIKHNGVGLSYTDVDVIDEKWIQNFENFLKFNIFRYC